MKTRLICGITIACIACITMEALKQKQVIQKTTTIQITCPQTKPACVKLPNTGVLSTNQ